jgi:hypothetical protein
MRILCAYFLKNQEFLRKMLTLRTHYAHSACVSRKSSVNLSLSEDARRKAKELKEILNRPSVTNVVEYLIAQRHAQQFGPPTVKKEEEFTPK